MENLLALLPSVGAVVIVILALYVIQRVLERGEAASSGHRFRNQIIMIGLTATGVLLIILVLPLGDTLRGQLLSLIGIVVSAGIALSSTTFLGNAMAGVMLRAVKNFRTGDFISSGDHFGRVSERGLFHTEIQTENRDLTTLPNLYLVTHAVTTTRSSGTIVSATVSIGYDVSHARIKELLLSGAEQAELKDPFVQILELGDYSVTYRIAGLLTEVKQLLSVRSRLRESVLDKLHEGGVEIVSPSFMNTRALSEGKIFIPKPSYRVRSAEKKSGPEDVVFDKAEEAESLETLKDSCLALSERKKALQSKMEELPEGSDREKLQREIASLEISEGRLEELIAMRENRSGGQ